MEAIERDNPPVKGVLPKDYTRPGGYPPPTGRGDGGEGRPAYDLLGRVYGTGNGGKAKAGNADFT